MNDIAIRVENLSKRYRIGLKEQRQDTLVGTLTTMFRNPLKNLQRLRGMTEFSNNGHEEEDVIWALKNISFEVKQGEVVGIIGRNGAGKSTLLRILSRITHPTRGRVELQGRVSSLLEVGTGFHPELTGRENIYLNGTILGMSKAEVDQKFEEIVDFSGVEKFIDTPVKRYSSGMRVRLAFSIAAHLEPEILLVDEVLAVGDAEFQKKCLGKMDNVSREGRTILFVSHNMGAIESLCEKSILLQNGRVIMFEETSACVERYLSLHSRMVFDQNLSHHPNRNEIYKPILSRLRILDSKGNQSSSFSIGENVIFEVGFAEDCGQYNDASLTIGIFNSHGQLVCGLLSSAQMKKLLRVASATTVYCKLRNLRLTPGNYYINVAFSNLRKVIDRIDEVAAFEVLSTDVYRTGRSMEILRKGILAPEVEWDIQNT
jgi:lipopolysaccharide transport system ATP-binding protein